MQYQRIPNGVSAPVLTLLSRLYGGFQIRKGAEALRLDLLDRGQPHTYQRATQVGNIRALYMRTYQETLYLVIRRRSDVRKGTATAVLVRDLDLPFTENEVFGEIRSCLQGPPPPGLDRMLYLAMQFISSPSMYQRTTSYVRAYLRRHNNTLLSVRGNAYTIGTQGILPEWSPLSDLYDGVAWEGVYLSEGAFNALVDCFKANPNLKVLSVSSATRLSPSRIASMQAWLGEHVRVVQTEREGEEVV